MGECTHRFVYANVVLHKISRLIMTFDILLKMYCSYFTNILTASSQSSAEITYIFKFYTFFRRGGDDGVILRMWRLFTMTLPKLKHSCVISSSRSSSSSHGAIRLIKQITLVGVLGMTGTNRSLGKGYNSRGEWKLHIALFKVTFHHDFRGENCR